ncbi:COMM domain containing 5 [Nesidiocoris tenuis]|uniref:COMM domain-containing protein 5 n=1 Tax=Nesidiocoris tenuis TaxID=355587 RepID=A0ABN7AMR0_9HEMI|nr:COMM domain containing 5 [Nesidiocoris tenuis]
MKTIKDIRWRVNVILSSRDCSRVIEPTVYVELILNNGEIESLEMSESKFHYLRQNVALLLREVDNVKRKGKNICRLLGQDVPKSIEHS